MAREKLNQMRLLMVDFYLAGASKADSMRLAGYAESTAKSGIKETFNHPVVLAEIKRRQEALRKKYELNEDWVIQRLMRIADSGAILARFKIVRPDGHLDWDFTGATEDELAAVNELTVSYDKNGNHQMKVGADSPKGALDSLCRKLGLFQDIQINIGEVTLSDRIDRGRERSRIEHAGGEDG